MYDNHDVKELFDIEVVDITELHADEEHDNESLDHLPCLISCVSSYVTQLQYLSTGQLQSNSSSSITSKKSPFSVSAFSSVLNQTFSHNCLFFGSEIKYSRCDRIIGDHLTFL